jgi:Na+/H+ antiporter NhaD/arsenite permease-like protein
MYILGAVIGGALLMIAAIATFIWLRHRDLLKKSRS